MHPDFDSVIAQILARDPQAHVMLLSGRRHEWTRIFRQRLAEALPPEHLNRRVSPSHAWGRGDDELLVLGDRGVFSMCIFKVVMLLMRWQDALLVSHVCGGGVPAAAARGRRGAAPLPLRRIAHLGRGTPCRQAPRRATHEARARGGGGATRTTRTMTIQTIITFIAIIVVVIIITRLTLKIMLIVIICSRPCPTVCCVVVWP
jgi:hypothetical protein